MVALCCVCAASLLLSPPCVLVFFLRPPWYVLMLVTLEVYFYYFTTHTASTKTAKRVAGKAVLEMDHRAEELTSCVLKVFDTSIYLAYDGGDQSSVQQH